MRKLLLLWTFFVLTIIVSGQSVGIIASSGSVAVAGETLGDEELANGTFSSGSNWELNANVTIGGGTLNPANSGAYSFIAAQGTDQYASLSLEEGHEYKVVVVVSSYTSGNIRVRVNGVYSGESGEAGTGTFTFYVTAGAGNQFTVASYDGSPTLSIDSISVREVL